MMTTHFPSLRTPTPLAVSDRSRPWPAGPVTPPPRGRHPGGLDGLAAGFAHFIASDLTTDSLGVSHLNLRTVYGNTAETGGTATMAAERQRLWPRRALPAAAGAAVPSAPFAAAVLAFHNAVARTLGSTGTVATARRQTIWHYQWLVVNHYLPGLCGSDLLGEVLAARPGRPPVAIVDRARRAILASADAPAMTAARRASLIAETLCGLIVNDPRGYWNAGTAHGGRWSPLDGVRPDGLLPDSLAGFFAVAAG